jgi:FixJ family two-component response regulator
MIDKVILSIIVLTSNADVDFSIRSISQGISDYLIKEDLTVATLYKSIVCSIERKKIFFHMMMQKRYSDLFT